MPPFALNLVRIGVSAPLFWLLFAARPSGAGIQKKHIGQFILCALSGVAINQLLFVKGLSLTLSVHGALLSLATPIFITAAAAWLLHEKFTPNKAIGLALGIGGAAVLILSRKTNTATASNIVLGDILIVVNAISYAFYFVWVKPLMTQYHPIHVLRWIFTIGLFLILPFGLSDLVHTNFNAFTWQAWAAIGFVALGATFFAYLFNIYGLRTLGPGVVGSYIYTQPLFATLVGVLFLNERLEAMQIVAAAMIAAGVFVVNKSWGKKQPAIS